MSNLKNLFARFSTLALVAVVITFSAPAFAQDDGDTTGDDATDTSDAEPADPEDDSEETDGTGYEPITSVDDVNPGEFYPSALILMDAKLFDEKRRFFGTRGPRALKRMGFEKDGEGDAATYADKTREAKDGNAERLHGNMQVSADLFAKKGLSPETLAKYDEEFMDWVTTNFGRTVDDDDEPSYAGQELILKEYVLSLVRTLGDEEQADLKPYSIYLEEYDPDNDSVDNLMLWSMAVFQALPDSMQRFHNPPDSHGGRKRFLVEDGLPSLAGKSVHLLYADQDLYGVVSDVTEDLLKVKIEGEEDPVQIKLDEVAESVEIYYDPASGGSSSDSSDSTDSEPMSEEDRAAIEGNLGGKKVTLADGKTGEIMQVDADGTVHVDTDEDFEPDASFNLNDLHTGKVAFVDNNKGTSSGAPDPVKKEVVTKSNGEHMGYAHVRLIDQGFGAAGGQTTAFTWLPSVTAGGGYRLRVAIGDLPVSMVVGLGGDIGWTGVFQGYNAPIDEARGLLDSQKLRLTASPHVGVVWTDLIPFPDGTPDVLGGAGWDVGVYGVLDTTALIGYSWVTNGPTLGWGGAIGADGELGPFFLGVRGFYQPTGVSPGKYWGRPAHLVAKTSLINPIGGTVTGGLRFRF